MTAELEVGDRSAEQKTNGARETGDEAQPEETAAAKELVTAAAQEPVTAAAQAQRIAVAQEQETAAAQELVTPAAQELVTAAARKEQVLVGCQLGFWLGIDRDGRLGTRKLRLGAGRGG